ncbi:MAG: cysteine desulfurase family protein [Bacilli bacterium]|nr:cysteine desulfurase family protein [Bacilli bacterium]MDD3304992.1 cysteine desulfurase family protein [Bacilli bacterium]MDD4053872.1 cysteine desulfurase family protein [Bacilli bacterium]MDD4411038.1 cysteine desulfurase family protein [Bacilli bacterium]
MIYLDYSATTPVNEEVLETFIEATRKYIGNPNSLHRLGIEANTLIEQATEQIANILKIKPSEIIYTSGSSESNNLAIKGITLKYQNRGKHIITTMLEHSSIIGPLNYLQDNGFEVDFVNILENGQVDINHLKSLLRDDTILVSICAVDSEIGIRQPVEEIGLLLKDYPKIYFHVDMTQCLGKDNIDLTNIDLASFSAHKIYGIKGIGGLIKKDTIMLEPIIHGGKSTTVFRSGTPTVGLVASLSKALRLSMIDFDKRKDYIKTLNTKLKNFLLNYDKVVINSNDYSIPNVLNFSVIGTKPETFLHALEEDEIYISTKSACSAEDTISKSVYALSKREEVANSTLRISLSYLTSDEEIEAFMVSFDKNYKRLI